MTAVYRTLSYTTASVTAASSVQRNDVIAGNVVDIIKIKVTPSVQGAGENTKVEIFKRDTFSATDLCYATKNFLGILIDPIQDDGVTTTERNEGFIATYEDLDNTSELHLKITNNGTVSRTFDVVVTYIDHATRRGFKNVKEYGLTGDGTTDERANFNTLVNTTLNSATDLVLPVGTYRISSNMTVPSYINLVFENGAKFTVDTGVTLTIAGTIVAYKQQIFSGLGTIAFTDAYLGAGSYSHAVYPEWWGAVANASTDCGPGIQKAINSGARKIILSGGEYGISTQITITARDWHLEGQSWVLTDIVPLATNLSSGGSANAIFVNTNTNLNSTISNLRFHSPIVAFTGWCFWCEEGGSPATEAAISLRVLDCWIAPGTNAAGFLHGDMVDCIISRNQFEFCGVCFEVTGTFAGNMFEGNACTRNTAYFIHSSTASNLNTVRGLQVKTQNGFPLIYAENPVDLHISDIHLDFDGSGTEGRIAHLSGAVRCSISHFSCTRAIDINPTGIMGAFLFDGCQVKVTNGFIENANSGTQNIRMIGANDIDLENITFKNNDSIEMGISGSGEIRMRGLMVTHGARQVIMPIAAGSTNITVANSDFINNSWAAAWSGATAYVAGNHVTSGGVEYVCILAHTNQAPPNATYWTAISVPYMQFQTSGGVAIRDNTFVVSEATSIPSAIFTFVGTGSCVIDANNEFRLGNALLHINTTQDHEYRRANKKGADITAANDLSVPILGDFFVVTGNTQINAIVSTYLTTGSRLTFKFSGTPTVKHNTAGGAGTAVMFLAGAADFAASANDTLTLVYDGTQWMEVSRTVI